MKTLLEEAMEKINEAEKAMENQIVYCGFTHKQLKEAFEKVHHPTNWKFGNYALVRLEDMKKTRAAVEFFTGGGFDQEVELKGHMFAVHFLGYYHHIGA